MAIQDDNPHDPVDDVKNDTSGQRIEDAEHSAEKPIVAAEGAERITFKTWVVIFVSLIASRGYSIKADSSLDSVVYLRSELLACSYNICNASDACCSVWRASVLRLVW